MAKREVFSGSMAKQDLAVLFSRSLGVNQSWQLGGDVIRVRIRIQKVDMC